MLTNLQIDFLLCINLYIFFMFCINQINIDLCPDYFYDFFSQKLIFYLIK